MAAADRMYNGSVVTVNTQTTTVALFLVHRVRTLEGWQMAM